MTEHLVVDVHQHLRCHDHVDEADLADRIDFLDRFGIDQACLSPPSVPPPDSSARQMNRVVAEYRRRDAARFPAAFGVVEMSASLDEQLVQLQEMAELGLSGVIWHHMFAGAYLDSPATLTLAEHADTLGLTVFVHTIVGSLLEAPWRLNAICERAPEAPIVVLDGLSGFHHGLSVIELAQRWPQIHLDTAVLCAYGNLLERAVDALGDERILFGSDYAQDAFRFPYALGEITHARLPEASRARILGGNARRLLGLSPVTSTAS